MKSILDKSFRYEPAATSDIRKSIRREPRKVKVAA